MTVEQKEQHILTLIAELPLIEQVRIALMVLRGIEPDELVPTHAHEAMPWETSEFFAELDRRSEELRSGKVKGISGDEFLKELRSLRKS